MDTFKKELDDIMPTYNKYIELKREYQLGNIEETSVCKALTYVCEEIFDLISTIYSGTDLYKERKAIKKLIESLKSQYLS